MHNKIFKRSIAFLLSLIITISTFPLNIVFANLQSHVINLNLQNVFSANQTGYTINFSWTNPSWSNTSDGQYNDFHEPTGFKLQGANATARGSYQEYENISGANVTSVSTTQNLNSGSIYEFRVTPYHYHRRSDGTSVLANYDNSTPQETVLFMTDIEVEATGSGNTLTVTFDNPQYKGTNIFNGYRIYYQRGGSDTTNFTNYRYVSIDDPQLVQSTDSSRTGVQRLTYVIEDANITQGSVYAIKVEPVYNNTELRQTGNLSYRTVLVNNEYKKISFKSISDKEYRVDNVTVSIPLDIQEDGQDFLKLMWSGISNSIGEIEKVEIYSGDSEENINILIGTIYSSDTIYINNWRISKPSSKTYYQIIVYIAGVATVLSSKVAVYDPSTVNITPNKPNLYLYDTVANNKIALNIYWDIFLRYPYTEEERNFADKDGTYIDTNITYDLWISDSISNLNNVNLPKILDSVSATTLNRYNISDASNPVYYYQSLEYVTTDENGNFVNKPIQENTTYYVKIIARKPVEGQVALSSGESIAQIYIAAKGNISTPQAISKPPLKIKTNDKGEQQISQTEINIEWKTKWFEIYDSETDSWYTEVAIRDNKLIFGEDILETDTLIQFYDKYNEELARQEFLDKGLSEDDVEKLQIRYVDLTSSDIKYEIQVIDFESINVQGGYEAYIENILKDENNTNWTTISPTIQDGTNAEYKIADLNPNTLYAVLLRPYRIVNDNKKEAYPTYILGTTLPNEVAVDVTPITPQLFEVTHSDTSITVNWAEQGGDVVYELAINESSLSDPSQSAILISSDEIKANKFLTTKDLTTYINYKINSLFPSTSYYIWVRAISKTTSGNISSEWSSSLYVKTDDLEKPKAPSGFGLGSQLNIDTHNTINNTSLVQADEDYIIVEWSRDSEDTTSSNALTSNGNAELLSTNGGFNTYTLMFKNLVANKYYYFRAKTKVTVVKNGSANIQKYYSYIIQASLTKDFVDAITIEVPSLSLSGDKILSAESEWTDIYTFKTTFTKDNSEYDGNSNDSLYPLPKEDFEVIYETSTQTLTYRFRSNQKDASGNADNLVDQRFISKLLESKVYDYSLDLTSHNGYQISKRVVEIPYTIFKAFEERKITLHLTAGNTTFALNPEFLNTAEVKNQNLGYGSTVKITIEQYPTTIPALVYGQTYSTTPQKISISVSDGVITKELSYTGTDMDITLKLKNRYLATDTNVGAYIQTQDTSYWQRLTGNYDVDSGSFNIKSSQLSTYTTISTALTNSSSQALYDINSKIHISDITNSDLTQPISVVQFNNLIAGVANNKTEVSINTALSTSDYNSLKKSNLLLEGAIVSREQGINSLVRLYEIKTKSSYKNYTTVSTTSFKDISSASSTYQTSLLKAGELGFFGSETTARPKSSMTIEEALYIANIILEDSGF